MLSYVEDIIVAIFTFLKSSSCYKCINIQQRKLLSSLSRIQYLPNSLQNVLQVKLITVLFCFADSLGNIRCVLNFLTTELVLCIRYKFRPIRKTQPLNYNRKLIQHCKSRMRETSSDETTDSTRTCSGHASVAKRVSHFNVHKEILVRNRKDVVRIFCSRKILFGYCSSNFDMHVKTSYLNFH